MELSGTTYDNGKYYYVRNLQGDVTKILDTSGNIVGTYVYDTWGKVISTNGDICHYNPIRYRGYYYDRETNLYYLNSRYYDPETGRFISPDVVAEGGNLYAYCVNDPVNSTDPSGYLSTFWKRVIKVAVGSVTAVAAVALTVATGGAALPVVAGLAATTLFGAGVNAGIAALTGGDVGEAAIDGAVDSYMFGGIFSLGSAAINAIKAAGQGLKVVANANKISYPPNNGFVGNATSTTLDKGTKIIRYGSARGSFVAPQGTAKSALSLHQIK